MRAAVPAGDGPRLFAGIGAPASADASAYRITGGVVPEPVVSRDGGGFTFGDRPTPADCYLVPWRYTANRFHVDRSPYPSLVAATQAPRALPAFAAAHPAARPAAPPAA